MGRQILITVLTFLIGTLIAYAYSDGGQQRGEGKREEGNSMRDGAHEVRPDGGNRWRGLEVAPENRCARYDREEYAYPQSVEPPIAARLGKIISPYTGECFDNLKQTQIEHIIARYEAHASGLYERDLKTKLQFSADLDNLTLASPHINQQMKKARDAAEWMPSINQCWFANRVLQVRLKYGLTIDRREVDALEAVLSGCESVELEQQECAGPEEVRSRNGLLPEPEEALRRWDSNGDGRIACHEARAHRIVPVTREHPAYVYMCDEDRDGVIACE